MQVVERQGILSGSQRARKISYSLSRTMERVNRSRCIPSKAVFRQQSSVPDIRLSRTVIRNNPAFETSKQESTVRDKSTKPSPKASTFSDQLRDIYFMDIVKRSCIGLGTSGCRSLKRKKSVKSKWSCFERKCFSLFIILHLNNRNAYSVPWIQSVTMGFPDVPFPSIINRYWIYNYYSQRILDLIIKSFSWRIGSLLGILQAISYRISNLYLFYVVRTMCFYIRNLLPLSFVIFYYI